MAEYSIGDAIKILMERNGWKPKAHEIRLREEWEAITGKTIAKYTTRLQLNSTTLTIYTNMAALKQELHYGKEQLINTINQYFQERVVMDIIVK